jgi:hypothetical protein
LKSKQSKKQKESRALHGSEHLNIFFLRNKICVENWLLADIQNETLTFHHISLSI